MVGSLDALLLRIHIHLQTLLLNRCEHCGHVLKLYPLLYTVHVHVFSTLAEVR